MRWRRVYVLAVLTAIANAAANVLMSKAARAEPRERQFRLRLIFDLIRSRPWQAGLAVTLTSYVLGTAALGTGTLTVIQPIVAIELPLTVLGAALVYGLRLGRREWRAIAVMSVGLAGMVFFLSPEAGRPTGIASSVWILGSLSTGALIAALYALGRHSGRSPPAPRAWAPPAG